MNFDEALQAELKTIIGLETKVFPLAAPEKALAPYLVFKKDNVKFKKTLSGALPKAEGFYTLTLITKTYEELQLKTSSITDKLWSFLGRNIGTSGPLIENVTVELMGDQYEPEVDLLRADISLKINY